MSIELASTILRHIDRIRQNPATAVAPEEIAELERAARWDLDGTRIATTAPVADRTELSRVLLTAANSDSVTDDFPNLAEPSRIVGFYPTLIAIEAGKTAPPLDAVDVRISLGRNNKEEYTNAQNLKQDATAPIVPQSSFVNLGAISAAIANRLMDFRLDEPPFAITFEYRWVVDAATRTALNWSNVVVSVNWFVRLTTAQSGRRGRC